MTTLRTILCTWKMDNSSTFLEFPLDQDLYNARVSLAYEKPPLRILITEAGSKIAQNLMYKICTGDVFGPDQKIILHLINNKGSVIQQRACMLDLEDCGFAVLSEIIVSIEPEKCYGKVDIVISIAGFEELPGHPKCNSFLYQLNKTRIVARNIREFGKPHTKLVVCGPSTKGVTILLTCLKIFEPDFPTECLSGVTCLDESIAKNLLGKQLRTTTNKIKNVVIWGGTFPDINNATVCMYPSDDLGRFEEVKVPVVQALKDQNWIYATLIPFIYKRILRGNLPKHGVAVASATARHLNVLYRGTESLNEIMSMAVLTTPNEPYGVLKDIGFSFPVTVKDHNVSIKPGISYDTSTWLLMQKLVDKYQNDLAMISIYNMVKFIKDFELKTGEQFIWTEHYQNLSATYHSPHLLSYLISPCTEAHTSADALDPRRKSIAWDDCDNKNALTEFDTGNFRKRSRRQPS